MSAPRLHPTAVIDPEATLADDVEVGPWAVVGPGVRVGQGAWIGPHAVLEGPTELGEGCRVHPFASVGGPPQHRHAQPGRLLVGPRCTIREYVTLNRGTVEGGGVTRVGADCLLMAYSHVAHDCLLGDHVVLSNCATLAGHVRVDEGAVLGGLCAIQQFSHIGRLAFVAGGAMVPRDVPPFMRVAGDRATLVGLNLVGLERAGFGVGPIRALRRAWRALFRDDSTVAEATRRLRDAGGLTDEVAELLDFIERSTRGVCGPRAGRSDE